MKILAEHGIDIFSVNTHTGNNVLHIAVEKNYFNIVKMLIKSKFPLDNPNREGVTALGIASCKDKHFAISRLLIKAGADVNYRTNIGIGPLFLAIKFNNYQGIRLLL